MISTELLLDFFRHMEWADAEVWKAVLSSAEAKTDTRLRETLYHLHLAQWAFLRTWRGESRDTPYPKYGDLPPIGAWALRYHRELAKHITTFDDRKLSESMALPWADIVERRLGRPPGPTTLGETALQVVLHSAYHRGQVNTRLRSVGGSPPLVDYIGWVWLDRPAAEWPASAAEESPDGSPVSDR